MTVGGESGHVPVWTVELVRNGRIFGPCKWRWTLFEGGVYAYSWYGCARWTCVLGARIKRNEIIHKRRSKAAVDRQVVTL